MLISFSQDYCNHHVWRIDCLRFEHLSQLVSLGSLFLLIGLQILMKIHPRIHFNASLVDACMRESPCLPSRRRLNAHTQIYKISGAVGGKAI